MNCKPGDLAVIRPTYGVPDEVGAFVVVLRAGVCGEQITMRCGGVSKCNDTGAWLCDSRASKYYPCFIRDSHLRPIRDGDGEDEMLRIAGYPAKEEYHV